MTIIAKKGRYADYYFAATNFELAALWEYHTLVESRLPALIDEFETANEALARAEDVQGMLARWHVEAMMPHVLRVPLLLSLWAVYESALVEISDTLGQHSGVGYSLLSQRSELPKRLDASYTKKWMDGILSRAKLFFEGEFGFTLYPDAGVDHEFARLLQAAKYPRTCAWPQRCTEPQQVGRTRPII